MYPCFDAIGLAHSLDDIADYSSAANVEMSVLGSRPLRMLMLLVLRDRLAAIL